MSFKDQFFLVVILGLVIVIIFLRNCTPITQTLPAVTTVTEYKIDTLYLDKIIRDSIPYPVPVTSTVIKEATYQDTCPPIVENTYEFGFTDSLISGKTTIKAIGTISSFVRDFKIKEKIITKEKKITTTITNQPKNQYYVGIDLGGNLAKDVSGLGISFTFASKKGYALSLRKDLIQNQTFIGAHFNLRNP